MSKFFIDDAGHTRVFHGVNAVQKLPPYLPQAAGFSITRSLSDVDAANLSSWGINIVRLGVLWVGVMPAPGQLNHTYLEAARSMVRMLAAHGIYTLIDAHQDVMGARFCGEGFPSWAVEKALRLSSFNASDPATSFPAPFDWNMSIDPGTGLPSRRACSSHGDFSQYYTTTEATAARESFFASAEMHADFGDHWEAVAATFKDESSVLGYEVRGGVASGRPAEWRHGACGRCLWPMPRGCLRATWNLSHASLTPRRSELCPILLAQLINEPWNNAPWASDTKELLPLYQELHSRIRTQDNETIVFFEPHVLNGQLGVASDLPPGGPGGVAYNDRQAFAYHVYCQNDTSSLPSLLLCDAALHLGWSSEERSTHVGGGRMLTEFGAVSDSAHALDVLRLSLDLADKHMQSWAYWSFKSFDDVTTSANPLSEGFYRLDGSLQEAKVRVLSRPYAPLIAGQPMAWGFDEASGVYTLRYTCSEGLAGTTTIFASQALHFPTGVAVSITPPSAASWVQASENFIEVRHNAAALHTSLELEVVVRPL